MNDIFNASNHIVSTFATEFNKQSINQKQKANETNEKIHFEFPLADAVYNDVRTDRDNGNGGR